MRKLVIPLLCCLLVLTSLLSSYSTVSATDLDNPVITPVSGDMEFSTTIVSTSSLPGITELPGGMLVPVGFPSGEAQFQGNGIRISEFETGKATVCFSITGTEVGWGGKVGLWDGEKWIMVPTTITSYEENLVSSACATITSGGTYAFIRWVAHPELLPGCEYDTSKWRLGTWPDNDSLRFWIEGMENVAYGTMVYYRVLGMDPAGGLTGATSGEGFVGNFVPGDADFIDYTFYNDVNVRVRVLVFVGKCRSVFDKDLIANPINEPAT